MIDLLQQHFLFNDAGAECGVGLQQLLLALAQVAEAAQQFLVLALHFLDGVHRLLTGQLVHQLVQELRDRAVERALHDAGEQDGGAALRGVYLQAVHQAPGAQQAEPMPVFER